MTVKQKNVFIAIGVIIVLFLVAYFLLKSGSSNLPSYQEKVGEREKAIETPILK